MILEGMHGKSDVWNYNRCSFKWRSIGLLEVFSRQPSVDLRTFSTNNRCKRKHAKIDSKGLPTPLEEAYSRIRTYKWLDLEKRRCHHVVANATFKRYILSQKGIAETKVSVYFMGNGSSSFFSPDSAGLNRHLILYEQLITPLMGINY
jgi:hypothetical protein